MNGFDEPDIWEDADCDPQMKAYRTMSPGRYAHTADLVDVCMTISCRPCADGECDEDRACGRHRRAPEAAERYLARDWRLE